MRPKLAPAIAAIIAGAGVFALLRRRRPTTKEDRRADALDQLVDEASLESFPASDPPSWTLGDDRSG